MIKYILKVYSSKKFDISIVYLLDRHIKETVKECVFFFLFFINVTFIQSYIDYGYVAKISTYIFLIISIQFNIWY